MSLAAALIYWVIISIWLAVLGTVAVAYYRNPQTFGTTRLLLIVVSIDTVRNITENLYFGLYFGAQYGLFSASIVPVLGKPGFLIIPKLMNVIAASVVLGLLLLRRCRWLCANVSRPRATCAKHRTRSHAKRKSIGAFSIRPSISLSSPIATASLPASARVAHRC